MTPDERIEKLLNRAGQTISDLPKPSAVVYEYPKDMRRYIPDVAARWHGRLNYGSCDLEDYILHLTDIIDRMETALENVIGERDYLAKHIKKSAKPTCAACAYNEVPLAHDPCRHCSFGIVEAFKFARVPEDWSVDDELDDSADA